MKKERLKTTLMLVLTVCVSSSVRTLTQLQLAGKNLLCATSIQLAVGQCQLQTSVQQLAAGRQQSIGQCQLSPVVSRCHLSEWRQLADMCLYIVQPCYTTPLLTPTHKHTSKQVQMSVLISLKLQSVVWCLGLLYWLFKWKQIVIKHISARKKNKKEMNCQV